MEHEQTKLVREMLRKVHEGIDAPAILNPSIMENRQQQYLKSKTADSRTKVYYRKNRDDYPTGAESTEWSFLFK